MNSWCLGTAQLGLDGYGVNNDRPADKTRALEVLQAAYDCGVRHYDTAQAYGMVEQWMYDWLFCHEYKDVSVTTKTKAPFCHRGWTLLYHGDDLPAAWHMAYAGASCYTLHAADEVAEKGTALQVPLNVYQMGFWTSGIIQKALANDVTVFARSVFAQGYLLNRGYTIEACINAVRYLSGDIIPVIGCDTPEQVNEIAEVFK